MTASTTYECEPYVYPQNILGDEHPQFGLARNSWLSGTASWVYQAATQYILGIRAGYDGLRIDPCIPAAWEGLKFAGTLEAHTITSRYIIRSMFAAGLCAWRWTGSKFQREEYRSRSPVKRCGWKCRWGNKE